MKEYVLMIGLAYCTPTPEIIGYDRIEVQTFDRLDQCLRQAETSTAAHAYCTPKTYAPERSVRPRPRPLKEDRT